MQYFRIFLDIKKHENNIKNVSASVFTHRYNLSVQHYSCPHKKKQKLASKIVCEKFFCRLRQNLEISLNLEILQNLEILLKSLF